MEGNRYTVVAVYNSNIRWDDVFVKTKIFMINLSRFLRAGKSTVVGITAFPILAITNFKIRIR